MDIVPGYESHHALIGQLAARPTCILYDLLIYRNGNVTIRTEFRLLPLGGVTTLPTYTQTVHVSEDNASSFLRKYEVLLQHNNKCWSRFHSIFPYVLFFTILYLWQN